MDLDAGLRALPGGLVTRDILIGVAGSVATLTLIYLVKMGARTAVRLGLLGKKALAKYNATMDRTFRVHGWVLSREPALAVAWVGYRLALFGALETLALALLVVGVAKEGPGGSYDAPWLLAGVINGLAVTQVMELRFFFRSRWQPVTNRLVLDEKLAQEAEAARGAPRAPSDVAAPGVPGRGPAT